MIRYYLLLFLFAGAFNQLPGKTTNSSSESPFSARYEKDGVVCLLDSMQVNVSENGSGTFLIHQVFVIRNPEKGLKYRVIKYDYDPLTAFASFQYIHIKKKNGQKIAIDPQTAYDYAAPARAIYWGARQIMAEVGRLEAGDTLEYQIHKKGFTYALLQKEPDEDRFIPPMRGQFYDIVPFWVNQPTLRKVYQIRLPASKPLNYQFYQGDCHLTTVKGENQNIFTFRADSLLPFSKEPNMVDLYDAAPKLMLSTTPDWKEKSRWFYKVNEDYGSFAPTPEAQAKVDELIREAKDEMEKITILTHWVADNMRYSGISMGKGEGYTLHNTRTNFTDRCGVCKDKAALLISMLRMAGFEAYPAMTMAGSRVELIPADHFNHSVAVVKLSDGTYMPLDPTWVPFIRENWSSAEQQQNYLPGLPEGSDLLITPLSAPENHYLKITVHSVLDKKGTLKGEFVVEAEGQSDGSIRRIFTSGFERDWQNALEKELLQVSPQAQLLSVDYGKDPKNYLSAPIRIKMKFKIPDYALKGEKVMIFKPLVFNNLYKNVRSYLRINTQAENKQYGFRDACSRLIQLNEYITLPQHYRMVQNEQKDEIKSPVADFTGSIRQENNSIRLHQELALKKRVYEAADWPDFRKAVNAHKAYGEHPIIVEIK